MAKVNGKISKIMIWPTRKINLGGYNTAELSAGVEITFDTPVSLDSEEVKKSFEQARQIVREEFKKQYEPYQVMLKKK